MNTRDEFAQPAQFGQRTEPGGRQAAGFIPLGSSGPLPDMSVSTASSVGPGISRAIPACTTDVDAEAILATLKERCRSPGLQRLPDEAVGEDVLLAFLGVMGA